MLINVNLMVEPTVSMMLSSCTHKVTSPPCCCFRNSMNFMLIKAYFEGISFLFI